MLPSCMAFAVAVIQGQKQLADCPYIDRETLHSLGGNVAKRSSREEEQQELLSRLRQEAAKIDFLSAAARLGGNCGMAGWRSIVSARISGSTLPERCGPNVIKTRGCRFRC